MGRDTTPVSALEAARAALAAAAGEGAVAIVTLVEHDPEAGHADARLAPGARVLVSAAGARGTLGEEALDLRAEALGREALATPAARLVEVEAPEGRARLFVESHDATQELIIAGAGHIALPLAGLGLQLGFRVRVLDDREAFTAPERFPPGVTVTRADFTDAFRDVPVGPRSYVVLVTRAHRYDFDCLSQLLERPEPPAYVGMIGSRRRVKAALLALLRAGVERERLARIHAPVGLDIGAETPEEIAVSIAAELVAVRRDAPLEGTLARRERVLERLLPDEEEETAHG
ncbi:MAG TPA: XdhC family protein [Longimicrobiales bacterium]|nr:XdhC family protein [Longimicrobiales bacterium]